MTIEEIHEAAMKLPDDSKVVLAERLMAHVESNIDPKVEAGHLEIARRRRDELVSGGARAIDGMAVMARARKLVEG